jgi:hypothetical protein
MNNANHLPTPLSAEAMDLVCAISETIHKEYNQRDSFGRQTADPARLQRLEYLFTHAADRWRRRMGYKQIYN